MNFYENMLKYGLHDTEINSISIINTNIIFEFNSGVYCLDNKGKEIFKTNKTRLKINILDLDEVPLFTHIEINKIQKNKIKEITFNRLKKEICENSMDIYLVYFSNFENSILIKGYIKKYSIEIKISEINAIEFVFE